MKKLFLLLLTVVITAIAASAQNRTVTGTVVYADNDEPLIGASVMGEGTKIGTATDIDGNFSLSLPTSVKRITVAYIGMHTVAVEITGKPLRIVLKSDNTLDEVVVTGYGVQNRASFTGAAGVVSGANIEKKTDVNFVKALEGNVTGFQYNNSASGPGMWGSVYIRGMGSLSSSSQPLYVIDGVPVNSDYDTMSGSNNIFDPMAAYNPNDIESVTVLKDAAATAIYGSRAANGVIIITTKKGGEGRFNLTLDVKQGFSTMANNNMDYANADQTLDYWSLLRHNRYGETLDEARAWLINYAKANLGYNGNSYDWRDAVTRKGYYQDYNVSFSGTSGSTNYFASLGYVDSEGIVINSSNKRYSGRLNLDTKYKMFTAGAKVQLSYSQNNSFSLSTGGSMSSPLVGAATQMNSLRPFYNEDGTYYGVGSVYNPLAVQDPKLGDLNDITNQTVNANPYLRIDLPFGLWVKTNFGVNIMDQEEYNYWSAVYNTQGMTYNGLGQKYTSRTSTLTWTNTIGWNKTFNEAHSFDVLLGQEMQRYEYHYDYYSRTNFPFASMGMRDMATAAADNGSEYYREQSRLASYFGDAHYSLFDRYFISASFRRDGSSVFGSRKRWGNFWSVGAKWRLSQEGFLKDQTWLSNAAIRISYGTVGNQSIGRYAARGYYSAGYNYNDLPGMVPVRISNPELTWETSKKFDVGFDLTLLNRLNVTFDYYNDLTDDALYQVPISYTTGLSSYYRNIGKIRNSGVELGLNGTIYTSRNFNATAYANFTWNRNRVVKLADDVQQVESTYTIIEEGHPYRQFYMKEYAGVNPENGMAQYWKDTKDANGNIISSELTEDYSEATKRYVGSAEPKLVGAFGVNLTGWGFDLSAQFNYRVGGKVYDSARNFTGFNQNTYRTPLVEVVNNTWTPENPNAKYPIAIWGDPYGQVQSNYSTRSLMSGNFIRFSNLTFGYTLPKDLTKKALIQKCRIYTTFDNIHTWAASDFIGYNPETFASGQIAWQYPAVFTFTGGIQLTF